MFASCYDNLKEVTTPKKTYAFVGEQQRYHVTIDLFWKD